MDKIRALTAEAGIELMVVRPLEFMDPPLSDDVVEKLHRLVPEYRTPPPEFIRANRENFMDEGHFDPVGRENFSRWLTSVILAESPAE